MPSSPTTPPIDTSELDSVAASLGGSPWLLEQRRQAVARFAATPLPRDADEEWRYSRISSLELGSFDLSATSEAPGDAPSAPLLADSRVDLVDGRLRSVEGADSVGGLTVAVLDSAASGIDLVDDGLDAFDHLNAALCPDPLLISVAPSAVVDRPLQITSISSSPGAISAPRVIVDMGENSELTVISWSTSDDRARLGVPRVILRLGQASRLTWIEVQDLGAGSVSLGRQVATIDRDAQLSVTSAALGGSSARMRFDTVLEGRGSSARLDALYYGDGDQHHDLRTFPTHLGADTTSLLDFRGALDDSATAVYTGLVRIAEAARGTNAEQSNRIIKLSENAWAESVPNLEIHNNDVRCSHASAVGPIDADQRFYLESRGVPPQRAEQLVVSGFFADLVARTALPTLVDAVTERILGRWEVQS